MVVKELYILNLGIMRKVCGILNILVSNGDVFVCNFFILENKVGCWLEVSLDYIVRFSFKEEKRDKINKI